MNRRVLVWVTALVATCYAATGSLSGGSQTGQGSTTSGAISGVVRSATDKTPVPDAIVIARWELASGRGGTSRQVTDELGRFVFMGVPPSDWISIRAQKAGFVDGEFGQPTPEGGGHPVALLPTQWVRDLVVPLWSTAAVEGQVSDEHNQPVAGATIRVWRRLRISGTDRFAAGPSSSTDDRGIYRVAGLSPGSYAVQVVSIQMSLPVSAGTEKTLVTRRLNSLAADNGDRILLAAQIIASRSKSNRQNAYPSVFFPNSRHVSGAGSIDLVTGQTRAGLNFQLQPTPAVDVSGHVVADGPLTSLNVRLIASADANAGIANETAIAQVGAKGAFTFHAVPPGEYVVEALAAVSNLQWQSTFGGSTSGIPVMPAAGFQSTATLRVTAAPPGTAISTRMSDANGNSSWGRSTVTVGEEDLREVVLSLQPGYRISGRLQTDAPPGPAGPRSLTSIIGLIIMAEPASGEGPLSVIQGRVTPDGQFEISGLIPGRYNLRFTSGAMIKSVDWHGADHTDRPFDLGNGQNVDGVLLTLTDQSAGIEGRVTDAGQTAADAAVLCFPVDPTHWTGFGLTPRRVKFTTVSAAGKYRLTSLPAGAYYVVALSENELEHWQESGFLQAASAHGTRVTVVWGKQESVDLARQRVRR